MHGAIAISMAADRQPRDRLFSLLTDLLLFRTFTQKRAALNLQIFATQSRSRLYINFTQAPDSSEYRPRFRKVRGLTLYALPEAHYDLG